MKVRTAGGALLHADGRDKIISWLSQFCEWAQKEGDIFYLS